MIMRKLTVLIIWFWAMLGVVGCIDDQTTGPHIEISEITITMEDSLYFSSPNQRFVLDGNKMVSQTNPDLPLEFTWQGGLEIPTTNGGVTVDSLKILSNEPVLEHAFRDFGTYRMRLKVSNGQMAEFKYFWVVVGSEFDEGLVVLSKNEAGEGMFSMLNTELKADKLLEKTEEDFLYLTAADAPVLKEDILDFNLCAGRAYYVPRENYFYLLTRESGAYYLDQYSLNPIGNPVQFSKPAKMLSLHYHNPTFDLFAFTEDGDVISHCLKYNMEISRAAFDSIHHWDRAKVLKMKIDPTWAKAAYRDVLLLMDDKTSTLYGMMLDESNKQKNSWWGPIHYGCMIYLYKNKLTCWYPGDKQFPIGPNYPASQKLFDVCQHGYSADTEVIDMDLDVSHKYIYLAVYDPNDSNEMKGSIVVVNAIDFSLVKEYKNVCHRPMKIFYKPNKKRTSYEEPFT